MTGEALFGPPFAAFACAMGLLPVFVFLMNPYGNLPHTLFSEHVVPDINQRFQYPALIRSQRYDSIVIGTSDSRLLHPNACLRGPIRQSVSQCRNHLRAVPPEEADHRRTLLVGLDHVSAINEQADKDLITSRCFPDWAAGRCRGLYLSDARDDGPVRALARRGLDLRFLWGLGHGVGLLVCRFWQAYGPPLPSIAAWAITASFVVLLFVLFVRPI